VYLHKDVIIHFHPYSSSLIGLPRLSHEAHGKSGCLQEGSASSIIVKLSDNTVLTAEGLYPSVIDDVLRASAPSAENLCKLTQLSKNVGAY
jgi:hypothetical protein